MVPSLHSLQLPKPGILPVFLLQQMTLSSIEVGTPEMYRYSCHLSLFHLFWLKLSLVVFCTLIILCDFSSIEIINIGNPGFIFVTISLAYFILHIYDTWISCIGRYIWYLCHLINLQAPWEQVSCVCLLISTYISVFAKDLLLSMGSKSNS